MKSHLYKVNSMIPVHPRLLHQIYLIFICFKHEIVSPTLCGICLEHKSWGKFECKNIHLPALITIKFVSLIIVNRGNGYETRQSSLLYVFVLFFGLDPAQNTIVVYSVLRN